MPELLCCFEMCEIRCCFVLRHKFRRLLACRAQVLDSGAWSKFRDENWVVMWVRFSVGRKLGGGFLVSDRLVL